MQREKKHGEICVLGEFLMRTEPWRENLEQNFLADEREVYKGTPSEETKIE